MIESVSAPVAFLAGIIFFLSPCVWPMYPAYISYIAGASLNEVKTGLRSSRMLINALGFVTGFTIVFVLLGATATTLGGYLDARQDMFRIAAGMLIILFGVLLGDFVKIPLLMKERRISFVPKNPGFFSSVVFGTTFAFAWSPCATAILGTILLYASQSETVFRGMWLLTVFSLGFSIPFLLLALFLKQLHPRMSRLNKYLPFFRRVSGGLLVIIGLLVLFDLFADLSIWLFNLVM